MWASAICNRRAAICNRRLIALCTVNLRLRLPAGRYQEQASVFWDLFYSRNGDRFFRDRHYFDREFPELLEASTVLEVGARVAWPEQPAPALARAH